MPASFILFLQYILCSLDGLTTGVMMELSLPAKNTSYSARAGRILSYFLLVLLICFPSWAMYYKVLPAVNLVFTVASTIWLTMKLYGTSFRTAVILFGFYLMITSFSELVMLVFYPDVFVNQFDWTQDLYPEPLFATFLALLPVKALFGLLYRYKGLKKAERRVFPLMFWMNLCVMCLLLMPLYMLITQPNPHPERFLSSMVNYMCFFSAMLLLAGMQFIFQKHQDSASVDHLREFSQMQNDYYTSVERTSQAQAKLLHDYKNVLAASRSLLAQNQHQEAKELLAGFAGRLEQSRMESSVPGSLEKEMIS